MSQAVIARRYARALLAVAQDRQEVDEVVDHLESIARAVTEDEQVTAFVANPQVSAAEKRDALVAGLEAQDAPNTLRAFVSLLCEASRAPLLPECACEFVKLADRVRGILDARVLSAVPMAEEALHGIRDRLRKTLKKEIRLQTEVRPELIGGVAVRIGNTVLDGSLRSRLDQIRRSVQ